MNWKKAILLTAIVRQFILCVEADCMHDFMNAVYLYPATVNSMYTIFLFHNDIFHELLCTYCLLKSKMYTTLLI